MSQFNELSRARLLAHSFKMLMDILKTFPHDHPARLHVQGLLFAACEARQLPECEADEAPDFEELFKILDRMVADSQAAALALLARL